MDINNLIQVITVNAIPLVFAITLHEAAHAFAARHWGDSTAYMLGRMTLNPLKHIDPIGTVLLPLFTMLVGGIFFGWAKPVPVNFSALRNPKRDSIFVAAAGPFANFVMLVLWMLVLRLVVSQEANSVTQFIFESARAGINWNVILMVLNLFPILPLDGGRIVSGLLPDRLAYSYSRLEPYGMLILIFLLVSGALNWFLGPLVETTLKTLYSAFGLLSQSS